MIKDYIEELQWRGMIHQTTPGVQQFLKEEMKSAYVGFDPTADSLHVGNLVPIMLLAHFQRCGHRPISLVGGATGMIGDPSGKSSERNLLDEKTLKQNQECIKKQLSRFLNFDSKVGNAAQMVNNYAWMKSFTFLEFIRSIGKHITVNYMLAKDSVKNRVSAEESEGMSFTEFTYQLVQGYDFLHLYNSHHCAIQMGGSDQWGNMTTGVELIRRKANGKGYAITCPLITKADGSKFGKSEGGNVWLDPKKTSPFKFYQYWLNTRDEEAEKYIKIFTFLDKKTIDHLVEQHQKSPHLRLLQRRLSEELTSMVHSKSEFKNAQTASMVLYSKNFMRDIQDIDEQTFLEVFDGVPQAEVPIAEIENGLDMVAALSARTGFLKSNAEAIRALKENAISVNKEKVDRSFTLRPDHLIKGKYILINKGRRNAYLILVKK